MGKELFTLSKDYNTVIIRDIDFDDIKSSIEQDGIDYSYEEFLSDEFDYVEPDLESKTGHDESTLMEIYKGIYDERVHEEALLTAEVMKADRVSLVEQDLMKYNKKLTFLELRLISGLIDGFSVIVRETSGEQVGKDGLNGDIQLVDKFLDKIRADYDGELKSVDGKGIE